MKPLKLTDDLKEIILNTFKENLKADFLNGTIYNCPIDIKPVLPDLVKPTIIFTPEAYNKILTLVNKATGEIGWHGIVEQGENNTYTITDILVYPQIVTAATVNTDDEEYINWTLQLDLDTFNKMRFQGHSHVNMGVTPSGVDEQLYSEILSHIPSNGYYIFMIINKRQEMTIKLYDMASGMLFEKEDITLITPSTEYDAWYSIVKESIKAPAAPTYGTQSRWANTTYFDTIKKNEIASLDEQVQRFYDDFDSYNNYPESFKKKKKGGKY